MRITKTEHVRNAVQASDHLNALRIVKTFRLLSSERRTILQRAYEAWVRPDVYKQIGRDPKQLVQAGVGTLQQEEATQMKIYLPTIQ